MVQVRASSEGAILMCLSTIAVYDLSEALRARELMGEHQAKVKDNMESKLNQQISDAMEMKDEKARLAAVRKAEIKKKQGEETKKYYFESV